MKYHQEQQGSAEWLALRTQYFTASEAAAMMGCHPTKTRTELLEEKYLCRSKEVSSFVEGRIFAPGHEAEAAYRPIAEELIGDDLYPVTGSIEIDGLRLLASFDGLTMNETICFEHKLWNQSIADHIASTGEPPEYHCWQLEQQLLVSGARRALFVTSDGTDEHSICCWYTSKPARRTALLNGWKQFQADLASYTKSEVDAPKPIGTAPNTLPALHIEVTGMVTASNLADFKATALSAIRGVNLQLSTDQDFADAEASVKWCSEVEDRLKAAKEHALSQTASIDQLFKAIDDISAEARKVRLDLERLVKARKEAIRDEIQEAAMNALKEQLAHENEAIPNRHAVPVPSDARARIAAAMKGKKTVESLRNAADTCRAQLAIEVVLKINARKETLEILHDAQAAAPEFVNLCHDERELVDLEPDHLKLVLDTRLSKHRAAEAARIEAEREARSEAEAAARQWADRVIETPVQTLMFASASTAPEPQATVAQGPCRMLKLGELNDLIAPLEISATGLVQLGFHPAATDRASKLYRADDLPKILSAMVRHISIVGAALNQAA